MWINTNSFYANLKTSRTPKMEEIGIYILTITQLTIL